MPTVFALNSLILAAVFLPGPFANAQSAEELLRKGSALIRASRPFEAEQALNAIPRGDPNAPAAQTMLGYLMLRRGAVADAEDAFTRALQSGRVDPQARFGLGLALSQRGKLDDAIRELGKVLQDPSIGTQARAQYIQCLFWAGKEDEALKEALEQSERSPSVAEYEALLGFLYQLRGKDREALSAYRRALDLQPYRLANYYNLISVSRSLQDWNGAMYLLQKALELDPNQPLLYQQIASVYAQMGKREDAETARNQAQRCLDAELLYTRANRARIDGRTGEAQRLLRECLKTNPRLSKAWIDLGDILRRSNHLDEACELFQTAIQLEPANPLARLGLAATLQEQGERSAEVSRTTKRKTDVDQRSLQAEAAIRRAVTDSPGNSDLFFYLGYIYESEGKNRDALRAYSESLNINPLQVDALLGRARSLLAQGDNRAALEAFRRVTELEPANAQAWYGLIEGSRQSKDTEGAVSACLACLLNAPSDSHCRAQLAHLELDAGDFRGAADRFRTLFREGKASKDTLDGLAFALMKLGDLSQASSLFESSLKRYGPDSWVYANLGYIYRSRYNIRAAVTNYRRARELAPEDADTNHGLGFALYLAKDYAAAVEPLETAIRKRPEWGMAHFNLAMTYWYLKQYARALAHARLAGEHGVPEAAGVVRALSLNPSPGAPRMGEVRRQRP